MLSREIKIYNYRNNNFKGKLKKISHKGAMAQSFTKEKKRLISRRGSKKINKISHRAHRGTVIIING